MPAPKKQPNKTEVVQIEPSWAELVKPIKAKIDYLLQNSGQYGVLKSNSTNSMFGNRSLKFIAYYDTGQVKKDKDGKDTPVYTAIDNRIGYLVRDEFEDGLTVGVRSDVDEYYASIWTDELELRRVFAYFLCWGLDCTGMQVAMINLIGSVLAEYPTLVRAPDKIRFYTGTSKHPVVEEYDKDTLLSVLKASAWIPDAYANWIKSDPIRSIKYGVRQEVVTEPAKKGKLAKTTLVSADDLDI